MLPLLIVFRLTSQFVLDDSRRKQDDSGDKTYSDTGDLASVRACVVACETRHLC